MKTIMKKSILLALFTTLSTTALCTSAQERTDWSKNLETLRLITKNADGKGFAVPISIFSPELQKDIREIASKNSIDIPEYGVKILSMDEKWNTVFRMFSTNETIEQEKANTIKHECLEGDFLKRRPIKTIFGWMSLASVEKNALTNPKQHNAIVTSLARNPKLIKQLNKLLKMIKESEDALLSFWKEESIDVKNLIDSLYTKRGNPHFHRNYSSCWQEVFTHARTEKPNAEEMGELIASAFLSSITGGLYWPTSADVTFFKRKRDITNFLYSRTHSVAILVQALDAELNAIHKHPKLCLLPHAQALKVLRSTDTRTHSLNHLFTLLRTNTFKSKPSFFSFKGRLRVAYKLIDDFKDDLIPLLMALGELDAYLTYASLSTTAMA
jgi:hypothetical protein